MPSPGLSWFFYNPVTALTKMGRGILISCKIALVHVNGAQGQLGQRERATNLPRVLCQVQFLAVMYPLTQKKLGPCLSVLDSPCL